MDNTATPVVQQTERPMSPHLGIYRWQLTMTLSIVHRATGVALSVGTLLLCWLVIALAAGADTYDTVRAFCASPIGIVLLVGWTWSLFFHLCNGIRHLVWDIGWGFEIPRAYATGWTVVVASLVLTIAVWAFVLTGGAV
ncbi:MAG TPA: succinate dehydrogenase, cytochrome b556 subunit [Rudaea sp.]|jgi:succinate dehydrogenase / fumarate reductase cytochrome b subunit|nr:succinate dehydrogenase, cytochrome b556 subunit [Rudaea sp.]